MTNSLSRRDFLKLTGATALATNLPALYKQPGRAAENDMPNVLIIVFDAFSARNIPLYGYDRPTTPHLSRLAERATVYHNHYAGGNYTFTGTSSLLTGTYPITNRAFHRNVGLAPFFENNNLFSAFDQYHRIGYTHNSLAFQILGQFIKDFEQLKHRKELFLGGDPISDEIFSKDEDIASVSWNRAVGNKNGNKFTLFFPHLYRAYLQYLTEKYTELYPRGVPNINDTKFYLLEDGIDWTINKIPGLPQPFLGYLHFLPPHQPYNTRIEFFDQFMDDGYQSIEKPIHLFKDKYSPQEIEEFRRQYDEFILLVDEEFNRLFNQLEQSGVLENTILVFTSDHGEMFERGILQHGVKSLHRPVLQIPLMVFEPGQTSRWDVYFSHQLCGSDAHPAPPDRPTDPRVG